MLKRSQVVVMEFFSNLILHQGLRLGLIVCLCFVPLFLRAEVTNSLGHSSQKTKNFDQATQKQIDAVDSEAKAFLTQLKRANSYVTKYNLTRRQAREWMEEMNKAVNETQQIARALRISAYLNNLESLMEFSSQSDLIENKQQLKKELLIGWSGSFDQEKISPTMLLGLQVLAELTGDPKVTDLQNLNFMNNEKN